MNWNKELRSPSMVRRFNITLITSYVVLILGVLVLAWIVYSSHRGIELPYGKINLKMSKQKYQPNDEVSFSVTNNLPDTVYVANNCPNEPFAIFKWQTNSWARIHDKVKSQDSLCYKQPRNVPIPANSTVTYHFSDWENLFSSPGVYRVAMEVDHYNQIPYQDFAILEPAPVQSAPVNSTPIYTAPTQNTPRVTSPPEYRFNDEEFDD